MKHYKILHTAFGQFRQGEVIGEHHTIFAGGAEKLIEMGTIAETNEPVSVNPPLPVYEDRTTDAIFEKNSMLTNENAILQRLTRSQEAELNALKNDVKTLTNALADATREAGRLAAMLEEKSKELAEATATIDQLTKPVSQPSPA
jgi:septal ring factor EnvC (AmiA/AmiB activator)